MLLLYNRLEIRILWSMKHQRADPMKYLIIILGLVLSVAASQASAACVVEYKAKQDNPLRLEFGTTTVPDNACTKAAAQPIVSEQLAQRGWTLLSIVSVSSGN